MKKTIVVLSVVLLPTLLAAQGGSMPKMIASEFMSGSKSGLQVITKGAVRPVEPAAFYTPAFTPLQMFRSGFTLSPAPVLTKQAQVALQANLSRLIAQQNRATFATLSNEQLAQVARMSTPVQTFLQGKQDLSRLLMTDTAFEFFTPGTIRNGIISVRTKTDLDIADPSVASFLTIKKGEKLQFSQNDIQSLIQDYQKVPLSSTQRLVEKLQSAARASTGQRTFLFEKEMLTFLEEGSAASQEFFAAPISGKKVATSTHLSFVPVKKDISVLTSKGLRYIQAGSFLNLVPLRLGNWEEAITPAYNIEFSTEDMYTFLQSNPDIPALFSRPGTYTAPNGTSYKIVRINAPFNITTLGTVKVGDYLDISHPNRLLPFDEGLLKQARY